MNIMNRPENTISYQGFKIWKQDFNEFKLFANNVSHAYMDRVGSHIRPFILTRLNDGRFRGMIIDVSADGIIIKGTSVYNNGVIKITDSRMLTLTSDWKKLVREWLIRTNEEWVLDNITM